MSEERVRSLSEAEQHVRSLTVRIDALEHLLSDHAQRFSTLQSVPPKRLWFWLKDGYPLWTDLNADQPRWRPWNRRLRRRTS